MAKRKELARSAKAVSKQTEKPIKTTENLSGAESDKAAASEKPILRSQGKLPVRVKDTGSARHRHVSIEIPLTTPSGRSKKATAGEADEEGDVFKTPMERRHITFDDSDHDEFVTPREGPLKDSLESGAGKDEEKPESKEQNDQAEEDEDDSDDEAPEVVSSHAAGAQILQAAQTAAKAVEQQAAAQRRKRQERDTFLKQQAAQKKRTQKPVAEGDDAEAEEPISSAPEKRKREVPKLLPLELLETDDEDDVPQRTSPAASEQPKRRKLATESLVREPKAPRDQKIGSTVFRVVADQGDQKLAPKKKRQAVNLKEQLLRRDRIAQPKRGFFVK
ncbi:hypothetical protein B0H66DRAFT_198181 [Apodospora peruviana]|uniref:Uncharacterized protein n=1 Tax=Apodospora peruviana TaxID=516989 RepID=A0AAE0M8X7_9PEZI|nr:hypothetical protein B0H66DRAFT_198181 [Apodospora peruviana]